MTEKAKLEVYNVKFFSSGSTLLDLALGGGWACRHIFNLVGDRSSGKTLLGIEAFANFERAFKECQMRYSHTEGRFDPIFASTIGYPDSVTVPEEPLDTIEDFQADLYAFAKKCSDKTPGLYILDSLDSLSDEAELKKFGKIAKEGDEEKGSYGTAKAKKMSQLFRMLVRDMEKNNCTLGIISQLRDNIGVTFGETSTRSGGRALNFYASQILWLREIGKKTRQTKGETRAIGVDTHGKVKKCSVGMPFREAAFSIIFGYGVDDEMSIIDWLGGNGAYDKDVVKGLKSKLDSARDKQDYPTIDEMAKQLRLDAVNLWNEVDKRLAPTVRKYR